MIEIIDYSEDRKEFVKSLNIEWLEKYASVEPNDIVQLSNPQSEIIDKGGLIFYALYENEIVGTVTLMKKGPAVYELSKMAVTEKFKGLTIGNKLVDFCITKARELGAGKLVLFSNTKLEPAIHLYKKFGFVEVSLGDTVYKRANIKMGKCLYGK